jgi:gliding motility-associated-like protein
VFLKVKNNYGCTDVIEKCLTIEKEFTIYIPNAFSPNENNINDSFYAVGINILEFEMFIFDRWGEQIFYSDDINKHWDGKAKGGAEVAQQDVYVWKVNVKDIFGKTHNLIGHVTLLK